MNTKFDVIVCGLGAMGSSTLYQLARRNVRVLGLDRHSPPHNFGSSHGETRITRQAIGEGEIYTPMALRAYEIFRELESISGRDLLTLTGGLIITSDNKISINHVSDFFENTAAIAKKFGIKHDLLDATDLRKRFPQFNVADNEHAYYEYEAGMLRPELCIRTQLELAQKHGAEIHTNERILEVRQHGETVSVRTERNSYEAGSAVISAGAWLPGFLESDLAVYFKIYRQVIHWFDLPGDLVSQYEIGRFPVFMWEVQDNNKGLFGFPAVDGKSGGIKIGTEDYGATTDPDQVDREVHRQEISVMYETQVRPHFPKVLPKVLKSSVCLYTVTPDAGFVIDRHPEMKNVIICSPCSGHGFKHSSAVGEAVSQLLLDGKSKLDLSGFAVPAVQIG